MGNFYYLIFFRSDGKRWGVEEKRGGNGNKINTIAAERLNPSKCNGRKFGALCTSQYHFP